MISQRSRFFGSAALALAMMASSGGCGTVTPLPDGPLTDVTWNLVELDGQPPGNGANGMPVSFRLGNDGRVSGNAGCNRYTGSYAMDSATLTISELALTRMYCDGFMDLESRFMHALENTRGRRIVEGRLELLRDGRVLALFTRG